jgi:molybdate transport system ATP-binding protein
MTLSVDIEVRRGAFTVTAAFQARACQTIALLGPNGSGKSSLLEAIAGSREPDRGRVTLGDRVLDDTAARVHVAAEHRSVGVVPQDLALFPHLSATENVAFPLRARGLDRKGARARARELLDRLELGHRTQARPRDLSGGEAQRVAIARALAAEPELLLLDEPLSALDVGARVRLRDLLRRELALFDGVRVLVTHDPVEASTLADRLVLLEDGRVTQTGTPEEIRTRPRSRYAADLVGVNSFRGRLEPLEPGTGRVLTDEGAVVVPWPEGLEPGEVVAILRPADVTLSPGEPSGSARNVLRGAIRGIDREGDRVRVRIASRPPVIAEVTRGSLERLGLREGMDVLASFKAVEVEVLPR